MELVSCVTLPYSRCMDMLGGPQIAAARLTDWCQLAQGLHARYLVDDFGAGAHFLVAVGEAGAELGHHPSVLMGAGHVDLKLVSDDAIFRNGETEIAVQWVTQKDLELAGRITEIAARLGLRADVAAVSQIELGLDTSQSAMIAPVWAALLTGDPEAQGRGTPGDEVRDATDRVPHLWFDDGQQVGGQRFHVEVYVTPEVAQQRITAAVAAGGTVVDDSEGPSLVVIADQDGNRGVICAQPPVEGTDD